MIINPQTIKIVLASTSPYRKELLKRLGIKLKGYDYDRKFVFSEAGYNFEPSEIGASFGLIQLQKFRKFNMTYNRNNLSKIRWTVDTEDDLKLIKKIVKQFHPKIHFEWKKIYKLRKFN